MCLAPVEIHTMTTATETKPKEDTKAPEEHKKVERFEEDDMVTLVMRRWATPELPIDKQHYLDRFTAVGGVVRNVPYAEAKRYVKIGLIHRDHIFPNNAQADDFTKVMGRNPLSPENLAAAVQRMSPDKITALLGDEAALKLAKEVQKLISNRQKED